MPRQRGGLGPGEYVLLVANPFVSFAKHCKFAHFRGVKFHLCFDLCY